jgi:hypothetical protein
MVESATRERDELQGLVQQAAAEMEAVQAKVAEGSTHQVRWGGDTALFCLPARYG